MAPRFPELIRVEASAGSGKTTQLALRYIDLLLNAGAPPASILAVTFTKKATVEMQDRILLYLKKLALGEPDDRLDLLLPRPSPEKAAAAVEALLNDFHDFRVSTIDSFLTALARATALENALSPAFEVDLDARGVAGRAMLTLLEDYSPATAARHAELEEALAWVLMTQDDVAWDLASVLEKHFTVLRHAETVRNALIEEDEGGGDPYALETLLKQAVDARVLGLLNDGELKLRYRSDALRQFVREGRPLEEIVPLFRDADKVFTKGTVKRAEGWGEIGALARRLLEVRSRRRLAPSVALHRRARALFARLQEEGNTLLLDTLQETIRDYIGREGAVPYVYIKLGEALQHYLIDEFQDTSPLQWAVFLPLVEEAVAGAGSLFFVGDVKQAIYGWRGGDYALFHRACEPLALPPQGVELHDNWRSAKAVPKFVEAVFARGNLERWLGEEFKEDDRLDGAAVAGHFERVAQETHRPEEGYVRIEPLPAEKGPKEEVDDAILARLAEGVREARRRHPWRDIAVIVRRNAQARMALQSLLEAEIPAVSPSALGLLSAPLVREVLAFLRWLDNPVDDLALAGFLLGRLFLGRTGLEAGPLLALLEGRDRSVPFYVSFREAHPEAWEEVLAPLFREAGFLPPYDLACRLLAAVDAFERFPGDEAFLYALLELVKDLESEGSNSLGRLLGALREAQRNDEDPHPVRMPSGADAVQVLTIHKAKGLEFPAVFVPWAMLDWHPVNDLFVPAGGALRPYRVTKDRVGDLPEPVRREYAQVRTRGLVEELNALYVACTRARDELVVLLPRYAHESRKKRTPILYEPLEIGRPGPDLPAVPATASPAAKAPRRHGDWQERLVRHAPDLAVLAEPGRRTALERGTERHRAMEAARRYEDLDPRVRGAIGPVEGEVELRHEQEIVGPDGRTYRVDLLIRAADRVWVIDYKTGGGNPDKDRAQVRHYLELARSLFPGCAVAGLLAYLDRDAVEAVP